MNLTTLNLYSLDYRQPRAYVLAAAFVAGNIVLPQLCHLVPQGGLILLPIYFFTLIAAYKYGWRVGLLTAIASPVVNSALFGMPAPTVLPIILIKSTLLALTAAFVADRFKKASLPLLIAVVLGYQVIGSVIESLIAGSWSAGFQDFRIGVPGMALQIFGGWAIINYVLRR